ncbi:MAG: hypothetical protein GXO29_03075 [Thermotogae bacterium]|nr:hypothetical protein [Thermotogota bacterium]
MSLSIIVGVFVAGGPHLSGFWMLAEETPLKVSFDPTSVPRDLSVSIAYSKTFSIFNDVFVGASYRGASVALEGRFSRLEGEYEGTASEVTASAGYSHEILEGLRLGLSLSYYQLGTPRPDIPKLQALGVHLASRFKVYDRWNVGLFVRNLNSPDMGGTPLPTLLGGYISFLPKATINTAVGLYKDQYGGINFGIGGSWRLYDILNLKATMRYDGHFPTFYMGFTLNTLRLSSDVLVSVHPELPLGTYFGINYSHR